MNFDTNVNSKENNKRYIELNVSDNGNINFPKEILTQLNTSKGGNIRCKIKDGKVVLLPDINRLSRVYIETTSRCNLSCTTCIRNSWGEPMGDMSIETFESLVNQLKEIDSIQSVMFGGFGEPMANRNIAEMIKAIKQLGLKAEITSNGTLLNEKLINDLYDAALDTIWVSFDGTSAESFEDVRAGASFKKVVESLKYIKRINISGNRKLQVGLAFVAMKRNINDLMKINNLINETGATAVSISNVLPYTDDMQSEMLCSLAIAKSNLRKSQREADINLPRIDYSEFTKDPIQHLKQTNKTLLLKNDVEAWESQCRFIEDRCTFVRWDGKVSPCMGLLHSYKTFLNGIERNIEAYSVGNISEKSLKDIWNSKEYIDFRRKVSDFDFSPCYVCGGCDNFESNKEDCLGNKFPTCGACLWAQGVIQCP